MADGGSRRRVTAIRTTEGPTLSTTFTKAPLRPATPMPAASRVLWKRAQYTGPGLPGVKVVNQPWWILVRFWWRQDPAEITVPGYRVNAIGWHESGPDDLQQADWMLDRAIVPAVEDVDPGAQTWGDEMVPRVTDSLKQAGKWAGGIVAVGALVALAVYFGPALIARGRKAGANGKSAH